MSAFATLRFISPAVAFAYYFWRCCCFFHYCCCCCWLLVFPAACYAAVLALLPLPMLPVAACPLLLMPRCYAAMLLLLPLILMLPSRSR